MAEKPILCAGPVVRAILDGRQTQDRRPVLVPWGTRSKAPPFDPYYTDDDGTLMAADAAGEWHVFAEWAQKPWNVGDVLYVRETWHVRGACWSLPISASKAATPDAFVYAATPPEKWVGGWRPSIHMPKWAARIRLRVVSVGVERVNAISEEDAEAEGVPRNWADGLPGWTPLEGWLTQEGLDNANRGEDCDDAGMVGGKMAIASTARDAFRSLWDRLYGAGSFDRGGWCWVTRFERVEAALEVAGG